MNYTVVRFRFLLGRNKPPHADCADVSFSRQLRGPYTPYAIARQLL